MWQLTALGLPQSTCVGIGGDPIIGTTQIELLEMFEKDPQTEAILMIGEIGGTAEEQAAEYVAKNVKKPVAAFIAGQTAPPGRRMGHAGRDHLAAAAARAADKIAALEKAGHRGRPDARRPGQRGAEGDGEEEVEAAERGTYGVGSALFFVARAAAHCARHSGLRGRKHVAATQRSQFPISFSFRVSASISASSALRSFAILAPASFASFTFASAFSMVPAATRPRFAISRIRVQLDLGELQVGLGLLRLGFLLLGLGAPAWRVWPSVRR